MDSVTQSLSLKVRVSQTKKSGQAFALNEHRSSAFLLEAQSQDTGRKYMGNVIADGQ